MKVLIIDDEPAMHLIMKRMLAKLDQVEVVWSFQETASAFVFLTQNKVDLLFVDINMPGENGLDFSKRLRESDYTTNLVFVTSHKEYALPAFDVFAFDYIVKPISEERLQTTIQRVSAEIVSDREVINAEDTKAFTPLIAPLTKRELEVMQLIGNGMSNKEIGKELNLKEGTIKNHIVTIFSKLEVTNRVQATTVSKNLRLIE